MRVTFVLLAVAVAACDASFDPLLRTDAVFSVSGYLDTSADTQWVRVEPFGESAGAIPTSPLDVVVTLAGAGGEEVVLAQEVRQLVTGPAHLFWAAARVEPGQTYRLVARRSDGAETAVAIAVPVDDDLAIRVEPGPNNCPVEVTVQGAARVADVQAEYVVRNRFRQERVVRYSHLLALERLPDGTLRAPVFSGDDTSRLGVENGAEVVSSEIIVAVATASWPETVGLTLESAIAYNGGVENGAGFVGGVLTRRYPFTPVISLGRSCMSGRL